MTTASIPAASAASRCSLKALAVNATMGKVSHPGSWRIRDVACIPSIPGICRSMRTMSHTLRSTCSMSTDACPSAAVMTEAPWLARMLLASSRLVSLSSTTITRMPRRGVDSLLVLPSNSGDRPQRRMALSTLSRSVDGVTGLTSKASSTPSSTSDSRESASRARTTATSPKLRRAVASRSCRASAGPKPSSDPHSIRTTSTTGSAPLPATAVAAVSPMAALDTHQSSPRQI
ncbi:hypothetical protein FQZ97_904180 [compost metagenome]